MNRLASLAFAILASVCLSAGASTQAVEREVAPLVRLFPHWQDYLDLPAADRSHFTLAYTIGSTEGVAIEDIRVWYTLGAAEIDLDLAADGLVLNPPGLDTLAASPVAWVNQPAGGMSVSMSFQARLDGQEIDRLDTLLALEQANQAMRQVGGVAALFAPSFKSLVFVFEGSAPDAWAVHADGRRTPLIVQEDRALYRPTDRDLRDVERLEFGRSPSRVLLET